MFSHKHYLTTLSTMSHPSGCPYNLMRSCDNPQGFDREACESCESCAYSLALIRHYQSLQGSVPQTERPREIPELTSTNSSDDHPVQESDLMEEAMKVVIDEATSMLMGHINPKYINQDAITTDLRPLVKQFLLYIKSRFDTNQIVDDDRCTELVTAIVNQLLEIDDNMSEIDNIKSLMPSLLDTLNQSNTKST